VSARRLVIATAALVAGVSVCALSASPARAQRVAPPPDTATLREAERRAADAPGPWLSIAAGWLARHDTSEAMRVLEQGAAVARPPRLLRLALAELHLRRGAPDAALRLLAAVPRGDTLAAPLRATAEMQRAFAMLGRRDTAAALAALERAWAARRDEATGLALVQLARLARSPRGGPLADSLAARPDASPTAFAVAADIAVAQGRVLHADSLLVRGTTRHPRRSELWMSLGDVRKQRRAWRDGALAYQRAAALLDEPSAAELALGRLYLAAGDTVSARATWTAMTDPMRSPLALHAGAERLDRFGGRAEAESAYRRLARADSGDARAWAGLARLLEGRADTAGAVALWQRADDAREPLAWPGLAMQRLLPASAVEPRRRAARRALWRGLSIVLAREQASGTAVAPSAGAGQTLEDDPQPEVSRLQEAMQALADSLARDTTWGRTELAAVTRAFGDGRLLRLARARAARGAQAWTEAVADYAQLVREHPADVVIRREHAAVLLDAGRRDDARLALALVLEQTPEDETAFRTLVRSATSPADLEALAARMARLRERRPGSAVLAERELELWHRLDRSTEAMRVAAELAALRRQQAPAAPPEGR
jgi:tetratricopeptide (TPR) repeat protein